MNGIINLPKLIKDADSVSIEDFGYKVKMKNGAEFDIVICGGCGNTFRKEFTIRGTCIDCCTF